MTAIRSRKPTGVVPYPFVLLEGAEKSGKSWAAAVLSSSEKVGRTYWIDLNEGAADEYGAIPGARYEVIEHDGTYADVLEQVIAVKEAAKAAAAAGDPPVVLVVDSLSSLWESLKDWATDMAKRTEKNRQKLAKDPTAEVDVSRNLWNLAGSRYRKVITQLLTFPGIVVGTARGKEVSATDPATGQPFRDGRKEYRVEGHRTLPYDATVWVRMSRTEPPLVVGARSVHAGIKPGADDPQPIKGEFTLERLIFDLLKCDPGTAHVRDYKELAGGELTDEEKVDAEEEQPRQRPHAAPAGPPPPTLDELLLDAEQANTGTALDQVARRAIRANLAPADLEQVKQVVTARRAELTPLGGVA